MRTFYIDVETTGLNASVHGIIALSYIIDDEADNTLAKNTLYMNPGSYKSKVSPKALEINGFTIEQFKEFPDAKEIVYQLYNEITPYMNGEKFKVIAFNAKFDTAFMIELFDKLLPNTYYKIFDYKYIDPFELVKIYQHLGIIDTGHRQNLEGCAKYYQLDLDAHNCESDIKVTRELWLILRGKLI